MLSSSRAGFPRKNFCKSFLRDAAENVQMYGAARGTDSPAASRCFNKPAVHGSLLCLGIRTDRTLGRNRVLSERQFVVAVHAVARRIDDRRRDEDHEVLLLRRRRFVAEQAAD